jgi:hypothetical protein
VLNKHVTAEELSFISGEESQEEIIGGRVKTYRLHRGRRPRTVEDNLFVF